MRSARTILTAIIALGALAPALAADVQAECYDNSGDTKNMGINIYQTQDECLKQCVKVEKAVYGVTKGSTCFCGDTVPEEGKIAMSACQAPCNGFPDQKCGGQLAWIFGYTGIVPPDTSKSPKEKTSSSSASSSTSTEPPSVQTVVKTPVATVTAPSDEKKNEGSSGGGTSKAGIAAGAVVGVIAVIAMGVGGFLVVRRNRRRQAEEEYRAAVAAKEFTASIRKPQVDTRLDPGMMEQRRMSDGSIADNQDYSRRILKVTNPDA